MSLLYIVLCSSDKVIFGLKEAGFNLDVTKWSRNWCNQPYLLYYFLGPVWCRNFWLPRVNHCVKNCWSYNDLFSPSPFQQFVMTKTTAFLRTTNPAIFSICKQLCMQHLPIQLSTALSNLTLTVVLSIFQPVFDLDPVKMKVKLYSVNTQLSMRTGDCTEYTTTCTE